MGLINDEIYVHVKQMAEHQKLVFIRRIEVILFLPSSTFCYSTCILSKCSHTGKTSKICFPSKKGQWWKIVNLLLNDSLTHISAQFFKKFVRYTLTFWKNAYFLLLNNNSLKIWKFILKKGGCNDSIYLGVLPPRTLDF